MTTATAPRMMTFYIYKVVTKVLGLTRDFRTKIFHGTTKKEFFHRNATGKAGKSIKIAMPSDQLASEKNATTSQ